MTTKEKLIKIESLIREVCNELVIEHYQGEQEPAIELLPIHLEHLLRAMQSHGITLLFMERKNIIKCTHVGEYITNAELDFTLPLHLQSDEFISWLYGVLVGE